MDPRGYRVVTGGDESFMKPRDRLQPHRALKAPVSCLLCISGMEVVTERS